MSTQQTRRERELLLGGVERAVRHRRTPRKLRRDRCRSHIERGSEGSRTCGRGAHAALQLQRTDRRHQIGRIVPIDRVGLGIVHRHAIERHIDARGVATTHAERGRTNADTALRRDHNRGHIGQNRGNILAIVSLLDLLARVGREGDRRIRFGAHAIDLDLLNHIERVFVDSVDRLILRCLRGGCLNGHRGLSPDRCGIDSHHG